VLCSAGARLLLVVGNQGCEGDTRAGTRAPGSRGRAPSGVQAQSPWSVGQGADCRYGGLIRSISHAARITSLRHEVIGFQYRRKRVCRRNVRRILVRGVSVSLLPEAKKIVKI